MKKCLPNYFGNHFAVEGKPEFSGSQKRGDKEEGEEGKRGRRGDRALKGKEGGRMREKDRRKGARKHT